MAACKALGIETMPVIIRELTDEEAIITLVVVKRVETL